MDNPGNQLVLHDRPYGLWLFGAAFFVIGLILLVTAADAAFFGVLFGGIGAVMLASTANLTIKADRAARKLTLDYRSLLRREEKVIPFADIAAIDVEMSVSRERRGTRSRRTPTYRVSLRTRGGETIPFRSYYSGGIKPHQTLANQLRTFIGVGGSDMTSPAEPNEMRSQSYDQIYRETQEKVTGSQSEEQVTEGVHWRLETRAFANTPLNRWISPDFKLDQGFIYVTQIIPGQKVSTGGLLGGLSNMLFKQSISMYGFTAEETPGLDQAQPLPNPDPRLEQHYMVFTNNPYAARQILNPWVVMPLVNWAQTYPLQQGQSGYGTQLAVLYGPTGVTIAFLGLATPERLQEITAIGVELVKSQIA
ncbi:MAG: hypothetical protein WHV44_05910 [Anaerolineales bacterium]